MRVAVFLIVLIGTPLWAYAATSSPTPPTAPNPEKTVTIPESEYRSFVQAKERLKAIDGAITDKLKASDRYWTALTWVVGAAWFVLIGMITLVARYTQIIGPRLLKQAVEETMKTQAEETKKELKEFRERMILPLNRSIAFVNNSLSLLNFYEKEYKEAIWHVTFARHYAEDAYKASEDPATQNYINELKTNEAYYKACEGEEEHRPFCLDTCHKIIHPLIRETGKMNYVDSYLFILKKYGRTAEEKEKWKQIYEEFREPLNEYLGGKPRYTPFIREYEEYYEQIQLEIQ
ncbi:MAG: hypothetical protein IH975_01255 [Nitrospinae bacterium]|nr:hypothetical protein [Nitrospinota bacterium]